MVVRVSKVQEDSINHNQGQLADKARPQDNLMIHSIKTKIQKKNSMSFILNIKRANIKALISVKILSSKTNIASIKTSIGHNRLNRKVITSNTKAQAPHNRISMLNKTINKMELLIHENGGTKEMQMVKLSMLNGKKHSSKRWEIALVVITQMQNNRVKKITNGTNSLNIQRGQRKRKRLTRNMSQRKTAHFIRIIEVITKKIYLARIYGQTCGHTREVLLHLK